VKVALGLVLLAATAAAAANGLYGLTVRDIHGQPQDFSRYAGNVTLVVNVASE